MLFGKCYKKELKSYYKIKKAGKEYKKKFFSLFLMVAMLSTSLSMNVIWAEEFSDMEFEDGEDFEEGQKSESEEISTGTQNETQVDEQEEAAVLLEESNKSADEYLEEDFTADDETDLFFDENEENSTDELVVSDGIQSIASGQCGENAYWNFYSNGEWRLVERVPCMIIVLHCIIWENSQRGKKHRGEAILMV